MNTVQYSIEHSKTHRREEMTFSETDSIGKVLKSVCKTFNVKPEDYELRYAKRKLDLNLNLMFSNLPDGVSLELCPINKKDHKVESVTVNLIIGDGSVSSGMFPKNVSLWDVSQSLIPKEKFVEEDRICMSYLSKTFVGPSNLKKITLSSLKYDEGPLNLSLDRKYSSEKIEGEKDKDSPSRNRNTFHVSFSNMKNHTPGTSKGRLKDTVRLTDTKKGYSMVRKNLNKTMTVKAAIDKHFYLTPEKQLNDLKYLNSRQGIAYVLEPPLGIFLREDSAVDLLDLRRDQTRSSDDSIEIKLFLPDETVVQAMFRYDERISDVFQFLSPLLRCQSTDYYLYKSNPTVCIEKSRPLYELEDSDGVNLYLGLYPRIKKTWPNCKSYLKEEHLPKKRNIS